MAGLKSTGFLLARAQNALDLAMIKKVYVGVDPGSSGAIAIVIDSIACGIIDVCRLADTRIDTLKIYNKVIEAVELAIDDRFNEEERKEYEIVIAIENVHAVFSSSAKSTFTFGRNLGVIETAVLHACSSFNRKFETVRISPQSWKKHFDLLKSRKSASSAKARELSPRTKFKRHDQAEAYLIALYAASRES